MLDIKLNRIICTSNGFVCDSCERAKATKHYNRSPQKRAKRPYQYIHTDLVGPITPITPIGFRGERYFFTFTDNYTRVTETYTAKKKSKWLKCLKDFYNLARTRTKLASASVTGDFVLSTQLDVEEPETYERAMGGPHA